LPVIQLADCDRCGAHALCKTVNESAVRWCLPCCKLPPAPRELPELAPPRKVARGSQP
jgi:hypothetical protein